MNVGAQGPIGPAPGRAAGVPSGLWLSGPCQAPEASRRGQRGHRGFSQTG